MFSLHSLLSGQLEINAKDGKIDCGVGSSNPEVFSLRQSWHENLRYEFALTPTTCFKCNDHIEIGQLMTIGTRCVNPDAPYRCNQQTYEHVVCWKEAQNLKEAADKEPGLKTEVINSNGWGRLSTEEKHAVLDEMFGKDQWDKELMAPRVFDGMYGVAMGSVPSNVRNKVFKNGGTISHTAKGIEKEITAVLLGVAIMNKWGHTSGRGSQKFKDAMKKGKVAVEAKAADIDAMIKAFEEDSEMNWQKYVEKQEADAKAAQDKIEAERTGIVEERLKQEGLEDVNIRSGLLRQYITGKDTEDLDTIIEKTKKSHVARLKKQAAEKRHQETLMAPIEAGGRSKRARTATK